MKFTAALIALLGSSLLASPATARKSELSKGRKNRISCQPTIAVANRNDGTLSILDAEDGDLIKTIDMPKPHGAEVPEPMYVNAALNGLVFVGDRANDWIVVFDSAQDYKPIKLMAAGNGVFHMSCDQAATIQWVVNDIEKTVTVFDINRNVLSPIKTIKLEDDCTGMEQKPHDLKISWDGKLAFVSCKSTDVNDGSIYAYDTSDYSLKSYQGAIGNDPHLGLTWRTHYLYVANQPNSTLKLYDQNDLSVPPAFEVDLPNAHGMLMFAAHDKVGYATDINGAGAGAGPGGAIYSFDLETGALGAPISTCGGDAVGKDCGPTAHNLASTGKKLFLTHSKPGGYVGPFGGDKVSIYNIKDDSSLTFVKTVTTGENPFGLDFVESTCATTDIL